MEFVSIRVVTDDVARLAGFYQRATGVPATFPAEDFAELATGSGTLAMAGPRTVAALGPGAPVAAANRGLIIEFLVDDVDALYRNLVAPGQDPVPDVVLEPTTMPWGNRSLLLRDPDGNLVNFFTPVTETARRKFAR